MAGTARLKDHWAEQRLFARRMVAATIVIVALVAALGARLFYLQVVRHEYFTDLSQGNRIRIDPLIASALSNEQIQNLPLAQEYRDLVKLIPGVQYTQDQIRGPSAGGSGQDNVYLFDGVNVTTPQYGTLSAEPASTTSPR